MHARVRIPQVSIFVWGCYYYYYLFIIFFFLKVIMKGMVPGAVFYFRSVEMSGA